MDSRGARVCAGEEACRDDGGSVRNCNHQRRLATRSSSERNGATAHRDVSVRRFQRFRYKRDLAAPERAVCRPYAPQRAFCQRKDRRQTGQSHLKFGRQNSRNLARKTDHKGRPYQVLTLFDAISLQRQSSCPAAMAIFVDMILYVYGNMLIDAVLA